MQDPYRSEFGNPGHFGQPDRQAVPLWIWILIGGSLLFLLPCGGCFAWILYIGVYGPESYVVAGNQVPNRFIDTMKEVGALEDGETLLYFYSDAMTDIRNGFYLASDRRVVVYREEAGGQPLTSIPYEQIAEVDLHQSDELFELSEIRLKLNDGRPVTFPVSDERGGDELFYEAIISRISRPGAEP